MKSERIRPDSGKNITFDLVGGVTKQISIGDNIGGKLYNVIRIQNFSTAVIGIGRNPNTTDTDYFDAQCAGGGAIVVLPYVGGVDQLFFRGATNGRIVVDAFIADDLTSRDLYQTLSTVIINSTTTSSVTISAPIPAGTNHIGGVNVDNTVTVTGAVTLGGAIPAGTNNIGDVDVLSVVPGTGAANLGKAEDAAHTSGDVGVMPLAVRQDTAAALAGTAGDYAPLEVDATGRLWVHVGAIDAVIPGTGATNLGKAEDAAHASGDTGVAMLGVRQDNPTSMVSAAGDYVIPQFDALGRQFVANIPTIGTPVIAVVTMTTLDTEYSYSIPAGTRKVEFTLRRAAKMPGNAGDNVRFSFTAGLVAAGTGNVKTISGDKEYYLEQLFTGATTIYFACNVSGAVMEIVTMS